MNDRIKLAEAMLPDFVFAQNTNGEWLMCHDDDWGNDSRIRNVPDPFTDANDDYAVLLWMRTITGRYEPERQEIPKINWKLFCRCLCSRGMYEIGDYARAALKVLESE